MSEIRENVELKSFTTFRVGGMARYFVEVKSEEDLRKSLQWAKDRSIKTFILGGGSNVLFSDRGCDGLVIRICLTDQSVSPDGRAVVGAGATLSSLVDEASANGLSGVERLAGIPGTVGGAVRGNAGAFGVNIGSAVILVRALDLETLRTSEFSKESCEFKYRSSIFKWNPNWVILSVEFQFMPGSKPADLKHVMHDTVMDRERKHPQNILCAGSFFMNPVVSKESIRKEFERDTGVTLKDEKVPAGWLIDHVGLRGREVGGAKVSDIHPNYIINTGSATAESILILSSIVKQKVRAELGVILREEVQLVGF